MLVNYIRLLGECVNILVYDSSNNITEDEQIPSTSIPPFQPSPKCSEGHDADPSMHLMQHSVQHSVLQVGILKIFIHSQKHG